MTFVNLAIQVNCSNSITYFAQTESKTDRERQTDREAEVERQRERK